MTVDVVRRAALGVRINELYLGDEEAIVRRLADVARLAPERRERVQQRAAQLVETVRRTRVTASGVEAFLQQYNLASREGVILMCLAEALLRIPDAGTADRLIADKIPDGAWAEHLGDSDSLFVNASTWGLMLTGRIVGLDAADGHRWYERLVGRLGEPVVRAALRQAMRIMGHQFVMGRSIGEALDRAAGVDERRYRYSFDMLGEAAMTAADAAQYLAKYHAAIVEIGARVAQDQPMEARHSVSVKLSALHPRYEFAQAGRVVAELAPKLIDLVRAARAAGIALTVDAEEAERLELSLLLIDRVLADPVMDGYTGFGLAVQAYQKRAPAVLDWLARRCRDLGRRICVRLVKGAYWDTEIKRAQERGLAGYPVFTRKAATDVSYLACAQQLARHRDVIHSQFATHNAHTLAYVADLFGADGHFEFQRLHGMGEELYGQIVPSIDAPGTGLPCRVYAPVGSHEDLLPYLVRRLLENGANTSFVNRIVDESQPAASVVADPVLEIDRLSSLRHPRIPLPAELLLPRINSQGVNLADLRDLDALAAGVREASGVPWMAAPALSARDRSIATAVPLHNPARLSECVGTVADAKAAEVAPAVAAAVAAQPAWDELGASARARILLLAADLMEARRAEFIARCIREAGKTLPDAIGEVREAVDFLRYYAAQAGGDWGTEQPLPGPTGERNLLRFRGRGVFACISPWNFPVAIFTGQVAAALVAGNAVLAKSAEQTPLCADLAVEVLHAAGVPRAVLQFLPGPGATVGAALVRDPRVAGVVFTGSTNTARLIARELAARDGPIATLIAETGGLNAMIVDSSALAEQVVHDVIASGFNSAGQRCSALRLLLLQEEIAPRVLQLLEGAMQELRLGDPALLETDIGPVIDAEAHAALLAHAAKITPSARWHARAPLPAGADLGEFFAPLAVEIDGLDVLQREVFGPVVHVLRFRSEDIDTLVDSINALGFGLTLGVHTRVDGLAQRIARRARVGNVYINRNMIGAVVGVQPFGGCGLSGTGPKAGGPHYLERFATEQTITTNTAAVGGNASLLSLDVEPP